MSAEWNRTGNVATAEAGIFIITTTSTTIWLSAVTASAATSHQFNYNKIV